MFTRRAAITLFVAQLAAGVALAQEYGRTSGGELSLIAKQPANFSGSLSVAGSRSSLFGNNLKGFGATLGGTLVADRMWFFGSIERNDALSLTATPSAYTKLDAHLGDRQSLSAIATGTRLTTTTPALSTVPAWFGSLKYTAIISPNAFFTASVSQSVAH